MAGKIDQIPALCSRSRFGGAPDKASLFLTTGQVAALAQVASRTVSKWYDKGILKGWRIPGSNDRRFLVRDVSEFFRAHGIPNFNLMPFVGWQVVVACCPRWVSEALQEKAEEEVAVFAFDSPVKAGGRLTRLSYPDHLVVGTAAGRSVAGLVLEAFAEVRPAWAKAFVVAAPDDAEWAAGLPGVSKVFEESPGQAGQIAYDVLEFDLSAPGATDSMILQFKERANAEYQAAKKKRVMVKDKVDALERKIKDLERRLSV